MIKAFLTGLGLIVLLGVFYFMDAYSFLSSRLVFWASFSIFAATLCVAVFVLGLPFVKTKDNDRDEN